MPLRHGARIFVYEANLCSVEKLPLRKVFCATQFHVVNRQAAAIHLDVGVLEAGARKLSATALGTARVVGEKDPVGVKQEIAGEIPSVNHQIVYFEPRIIPEIGASRGGADRSDGFLGAVLLAANGRPAKLLAVFPGLSALDVSPCLFNDADTGA